MGGADGRRVGCALRAARSARCPAEGARAAGHATPVAHALSDEGCLHGAALGRGVGGHQGLAAWV